MQIPKKSPMGVVFLTIIAVGLRWIAARESYPTPGDGCHFVQYGVAMAHGHAKLSTYWSQAMVAAAAVSEWAGCDPRLVLQGISFVSGVIVVLLFAGIALRITKSGWWGLAAGMWAATNPTMVLYSITGFSEMGYMAFLLGAAYVGLGGTQSWKRDIAAGVLLGVGGYFKGLDAAVAATAYGAWRLWWGGRKRWDWAAAAVVPSVAFAVLLPLSIYTFAETGQFAPGSKGSGNFLLGPDWKDSKVVYAAEGLKTRNYREAFRALPRQAVENAHDAIRLANEQLFTRGLRMGAFWFTLLMSLLVAGAFNLHEKQLGDGIAFVACLAGIQLCMMLLVFVHDRIFTPTLPWIALSGVLGAKGWWARCGRKTRLCGALMFGVYCVLTGAYATQVWQTDSTWWRYNHVSRVAEEILAMGMDEGDVVMHYGPQLAVETHRENPLLTVEVPFGSVENVGRVAQEKGVRFAAISDTWRGHWPIARIFDEKVSAPEGWVLRKELEFAKDEEREAPPERIRIYEVTSTAEREM